MLAAIPKKRELGPLLPPLPPGKKPNIIVILADDLGFDDIAMHHANVELNGQPRYLSTPNLDKLMRMSKEFRNFYVTPMCSQSRAELLTGRDFIRTGTLLVNGEPGVLWDLSDKHYSAAGHSNYMQQILGI